MKFFCFTNTRTCDIISGDMQLKDWIILSTRLLHERSPMGNPFKFVNDTSALIKLNHLYRDSIFTPCDNISELRAAAQQMSVDDISKIVYEECVNMGLIH